MILRFANAIADMSFDCFENFAVRHWDPIEEMNFYNNTTEVIWSIDAVARVGFPLVFTILQLLYWTLYLYIL